MSLQDALMTLNPLHGHMQSGHNDEKHPADTSISSFEDDTASDDDDELSVSFSTVQIHEFVPALGDNPACAVGPPIALSRKPVRRLTCDVDEWEEFRDGQRRPPARLSRKERTLLLSQRHSFMEMMDRQKEMWQIRKSRARNNRELEHPSFLKKFWHGFVGVFMMLTNQKQSPISPLNVDAL